MYDAVVIGSGAGGLTAGVALARQGRKVVVLEQHYLPGGWCHSFPLQGYQFSPGVHYVGELGPRGALRRVWEGLGVDLDLFELNPDGLDHVIVGSDRFDIPRGRDRLEERLVARFRHQEGPIRSYLHAVDRVVRELDLLGRKRSLLGNLALPFQVPTVGLWGLRSLAALFRHHGVTDPVLQTVLGMQGGDHGLPPSRAPVAVHASVVAHYYNGGFYPRGGGRSIPKALIAALRASGGEIRVRTEVAEILCEGGSRARAVGVRLASGEVIRAKTVISNADAGVTFGRLVRNEHQSRGLRRKLARTRYSAACISLFAAVDMDLRAAGMDSGNVWHAERPDLEEAYALTAPGVPLADREFPMFFLTATSLKDPTKRSRGHHTLEAFVLCSDDPFAKWRGTAHGERPAEYVDLKENLKDAMIRRVDRVIPGVRDHLVMSDLGTPLTNRFYCEATGGSMYATEKSWRQVGPWSYPIRTEIDGLLLCGASTVSHGVLGATMSGMLAAGAAAGCDHRELLGGSGTVRTYLADDPSDWPAELRHKAGVADEAAVA